MPKDADNQFIDVICEYTKNGDLIPLRLRIQDEDGLYQEFTVKGYKELSHAGDYLSPYNTKTHSYIWSFICRVQVADKVIELTLFFNGHDNLWKIKKG